mmetsp:Transcript_8882/g.19565  ORF Transcript_8882/g.19565 Transcript_8882/m.19565 type:complete len:150 (-) Transcript_8882:400-849(-)|eukprot:CAMPEP_0113302248 /NCGR_PEP_ID=MMETSP0010_2-20120614/3139_1 /TAXON_ID=216773 ORGANISM="Corethron hystrix, Strain 308" /NCGR_SAMPLE_ID=MMETSP0010_2 /ASSEMBLY_ACC=CAM_ASM_000155 /LENGTH=149 /DNA_ID=CAMNT_0000156005 /DNA_START=45 /DNA_END=494 /DNA_ORIENTATION=+ /assembly_acc=CAM_ASM_000155
MVINQDGKPEISSGKVLKHEGHFLPLLDDDNDPMSKAIEKAGPLLSQVSFGSIVGYCSGMAAKKIGKALAIAVGFSYIAVQSASYSGYVDVDWVKIQNDIKSKIDVDKDGEFSTKDLKIYWLKLKSLLTHKLPSAGGFSIGFLYGLSTK